MSPYIYTGRAVLGTAVALKERSALWNGNAAQSFATSVLFPLLRCIPKEDTGRCKRRRGGGNNDRFRKAKREALGRERAVKVDQIVLGETVTSARVENQPGSAGVVVSRLFQRELKSLRTFLNRSPTVSPERRVHCEWSLWHSHFSVPLGVCRPCVYGSFLLVWGLRDSAPCIKSARLDAVEFLRERVILLRSEPWRH